jgi:tetratricopeptide (TPR) repeat protein
MDADRWSTMQTLYLAALDVAADRRERFLREACRGNEGLYRDVLSLLHVEIHPLLDGLAIDAVPWPPPATRAGDRVDRYRLLDRIGAGGMGVVYRAERSDGAYEQTVALKLVKPGMDSEAVLRRFRAERQILAGLRHPGIARLLDGGLHDGRPYLVVEYVDGLPITTYCDRHRLPVEARLALFEQVCEAVAYAHQNLVVHRDLKPPNVLVTTGGGGAAQVKLLDFGIARLLQGNGHEAIQPQTQAGERVLTPAYAAPEQVAGGRITTATDVYGLGVVLYELLTGVRPIEPDGREPLALERAVLEQTPAAPSAVAVSREATQARGTTPEQLRRRLAGDLDTIVGKALRKEPERRYASAEGLLGDLRRHRENLPVTARPDRVGYRVRKFVQRHRAAVAATLGGLVLVTAVTAVAFSRVRHERDRARQEAAKAEEVAAFLQDIFAVADPSASRGETVTARELLDRGAARIETELAGQPAVQAQMLHTIGEVYGSLGLYDEAETLLVRALALRRERHGEEHPDVARTRHALGVVFEHQGRYEDAAAAHRMAVATLRRHAGDAPLALAKGLHSLAHAQMRLGQLDAAERRIREALAIKRGLLGDTHAEVAYSLNILGDVYAYQGRDEEAEVVHREVLAMRRALFGDDHLDVAVTLHNLAASLSGQQRYEEAEATYREALHLWRKLYGGEHQEVANTLSQLAFTVARQGRYDEAEALHQEALAIGRRVLGEAHPRIAYSLGRYGRMLGEQGRYAEAEAAYREAVTMHRRLLGEAHPSVPTGLARLGMFIWKQGRFEEAEQVLQEGYQLCDSLRGPGDACMETARQSLAALYEAWGRPDSADAYRAR